MGQMGPLQWVIFQNTMHELWVVGLGGLGAWNVLVVSKTQVVLRVGGKSKFPDVKLLENHLIKIFLKQDFQATLDIKVEQKAREFIVYPNWKTSLVKELLYRSLLNYSSPRQKY